MVNDCADNSDEIPSVCGKTLHGKFMSTSFDTVEHTYDACPKYSELGSFRIIVCLYVRS